MNAPRPLSFRTSLRLASLSLATAVALGGAACHSGPPQGESGSGPQAIHIPVMEASGKFFKASSPPKSTSAEQNSRTAPDAPAVAVKAVALAARVAVHEVAAVASAQTWGRWVWAWEEAVVPAVEAEVARAENPAALLRSARARTEQNPAVQLHLTLINHGTQMLEVEILEFSSLLGNFVVTPAKVSIAPGQSANFDPMTSRLGIPQGDLPVKVRLRSGEKKRSKPSH